MPGLLFGSVMKVLGWIVIIIFTVLGFQYPGLFLVVLLLLLCGPCVAIPAMIARNGKHVVSSMSISEVKQTIKSKFAEDKIGRRWTSVEHDAGEMNFKLTSTKVDREPIVSIDWEETGDGTTLVHVWMSRYWSGALNDGKGTPWWVFGSHQALSKVNSVAKALASSA